MVKIVKITAKLSLLIYFGRGCGIVCVYNMGPSKNDVIADSWACPKDCFVAILTFIWQKGNLWVRINYYSFKWGGGADRLRTVLHYLVGPTENSNSSIARHFHLFNFSSLSPKMACLRRCSYKMFGHFWSPQVASQGKTLDLSKFCARRIQIGYMNSLVALVRVFSSVFSNVSSNRLLQKRESHIGSICFAFLHYVVLNAS